MASLGELGAALAANRWISPVTLAFVNAPQGAQGLPAGPASLGPGTDATLEGRRLTVRHDGWRLDTYLRYRPLVYYAAFGKQEVFDCLYLALASLFEFGAYDGDVLVLTDAQHLAWPNLFSAGWRQRVRTREVAAADMLDWTLARYRVSGMADLGGYGPFLYLDTDIVCNAPVEPLLRQLAVSPVWCAPAEHAVVRPEDWYGASLFAADGVVVPPQRAGFSTGVIGFPELASVARLFETVPVLAEAYAAAMGTRDRFDCYDQPFANYAVVKGGMAGNLGLIGRFLDNRHFWHARATERKGLAHFTGGTDNTMRKLVAMAAYVDALRAGTA